MAIPTTRTEFKELCLRNLGKPVIEINVDDTQVEDKIDEALKYFADYHYDGSEKIYLKYQVTNQDKINKYITIPESVIGVTNIFSLNSGLGAGIFDIKYQFMLNNIQDFSSYSMVSYYMTMQHLEFLQQILSGTQPIRYNRHVNKLYIDTDWTQIETGSWIVAECYGAIDPTVYVDVWKDRWLINYTTAKIQEIWARNMNKFVGMTLPGNVQFNSESLLSDAQATIAKMEEEMLSTYSLPLYDMYG